MPESIDEEFEKIANLESPPESTWSMPPIVKFVSALVFIAIMLAVGAIATGLMAWVAVLIWRHV